MLRKYRDAKPKNMATISDKAAIREQRLMLFQVLTAMLSAICVLLIVAVVIIAGYPKSQGVCHRDRL